MEEATREMAKSMIGISDAELDKLSPGMQQMLDNSVALMGYKIVAEVVESENCFAFYKPGDKLVFNATMLNKDETTATNVCTDAVTPLNTAIRAMLSAIVNGEDPNKYIFNHVQCIDTGALHGGLGRVLFKVYAEQV
ncbi:MAG: hypothetical protein HY801_09510 [Candidatus Lindowbacteria bacterium]|nr:hypothetical protein [Candidatus Lindowbacteria bacterium]